MIETFFYLFLTIGVTYIVGYGLTYLLLPGKLLRYSIWLTPWIAILTIIQFLIVCSLIGIPVSAAAPVLTALLIGITAYVVFKIKPHIEITSTDIVMSGIIFINIIFNIIPILRREGMLTTISMGNNDIIAYTTVADYLVNHTISESFYTNVLLSVSNLLHDGYRWGPSMVLSYFITLFRLSAFQLGYLIQAILFGFMIPIVYVLIRILYKSTFIAMLLAVVMTAFNANLIYMLYHNFFGQVLFWGIEVMLFILFFSYFGTDEEKNKGVTRYDIVTALTISVLYTSYHEPAVFMLAPLIIYLFLRFIFRQSPILFLKKIFIISGLAFGMSALSIYNAIIFDFGQTFAAKKGNPIGWELFRQELPFTNPFEALGFYSIHSFPPLPLVIAIVISFFTIGIMIWGLIKSRQKLLLLPYAIIFTFFLYWSGIMNKHFWDYNRVVTYTLPFFITLFVIGFLELPLRLRVKIGGVIIIVSLVMFSAIKLNNRLRSSYAAVDKSLASLRDIPLDKIREPIYGEGFIDPNISYWIQNWTGYFTYDHTLIHYPTEFNENTSHIVPENALVLSGKYSRWYYPPKRIIKNIVWENEYYRIGRLCTTDVCIKTIPVDISAIKIGNHDWEDALLGEGWLRREGGERWTNANSADMRLVSKEPVSILTFEAKTYKEPQQVTVIVNGNYAGEAELVTEWKEYRFPIFNSETGVYHIQFEFSSLYDRKDERVAAGFKRIGVE